MSYAIRKPDVKSRKQQAELLFRANLPYCIQMQGDQYYMLNRDYAFIGMTDADGSPVKETPEGFGGERTYMFHDGTSPLHRSKKRLTRAIQNFLELTKSKECLNESDETNWIMSNGYQSRIPTRKARSKKPRKSDTAGDMDWFHLLKQQLMLEYFHSKSKIHHVG
jgi:hypothetical protein